MALALSEEHKNMTAALQTGHAQECRDQEPAGPTGKAMMTPPVLFCQASSTELLLPNFRILDGSARALWAPATCCYRAAYGPSFSRRRSHHVNLHW